MPDGCFAASFMGKLRRVTKWGKPPDTAAHTLHTHTTIATTREALSGLTQRASHMKTHAAHRHHKKEGLVADHSRRAIPPPTRQPCATAKRIRGRGGSRADRLVATISRPAGTGTAPAGAGAGVTPSRRRPAQRRRRHRHDAAATTPEKKHSRVSWVKQPRRWRPTLRRPHAERRQGRSSVDRRPHAPTERPCPAGHRRP